MTATMSSTQAIPSPEKTGLRTDKNDSEMSISSIRATKRKFDDALYNLDEAVRSTETFDRPSPSKKPHTSRSLYSTLAKYGIKTKEPKAPIDPSLIKNAPHLTAILSRTRNAFPFKTPTRTTSHLSSLQSSTTDYRPSSTPCFLSRLATFKLSTYPNKPTPIDAVAASKCGWTNDGKDRLVCGVCDVSWVVGGREGMNRDAANTLIEKQRVSLVEMHKNGCPWKTRQCDSSVYRIPLQAPAVMARDLKTNAIKLVAVLHDVEVTHPLTPTQIASLRSTMASIIPTISILEDEPPPSPSDSSQSSLAPTSLHAEPSDIAILTSLFGWSLAPPAPERERERLRTPSLSRATSVTRTPSMSRASSLAPSTTPSRAQSAALSLPGDINDSMASSLTPISATTRLPSLPPPVTPRTPRTSRDTSLLHCTLCQRRVGLWAFGPPTPRPAPPTPTPNGNGTSMPKPTETASRPKRQFDLLKEHRSYCPYVVRSSIIPSMPSALPVSQNAHARMSSVSLTQLNALGANGAVEGWRAVLSVVLKYGAGQRQRMSVARGYLENTPGTSTSNDIPEESTDTDADGIDAMMAGVKKNGGKDLLKYVKGLLG